MDDAQLPALFDPLLDFLAAKLPPPIYGAVDLLITQSYALISSLVELVGALLGNSPATWDMQTILPPIITLLAAYLALVSFYRTTGWMIRMAFAFVKWGFILTTLGGAAGYFFANANPGGNGLAMLGDGLLPTLGGMFLDMFNEGKQQGSTKTKGKGRGSTRAKTSTKKSRPKAWESWDKHKEWQYSEKTHTESANVQEVISNILGTAGKAVKESGWWDTAKGAYEKATQAQEQRAKGKSRSR